MEIIAEIGQAHEGSLGMALSYIEALAETGVDAVKFQVHIAEAESSIHEPFRVNFSVQDDSRQNYWKRMEFSIAEWRIIKDKCEEKSVEFLASPFSNAAVDILEELGVKRYKIGSGEVNNLLLLEKIARTGKPLILSSGMSSFEELDATVEFLKERDLNYSILQCTTAYPTQPVDYGFNVIRELKDRYNVTVGYSDHSGKIGTSISAAALGAEIIEFHAVFDRRSFGPDSTSSLEIDEISGVVEAIRNTVIALNNPVEKSDTSNFKETKRIFEKSLSVNKDMAEGDVIRFEDLEGKKPSGLGVDAAEYKKVLGKTLVKSLKKNDFLTVKDMR